MFVNNSYFQQGYIAGHTGLTEEACPLLFDAAPRKFWLCGHNLALLILEEEKLNQEPLERVEADPYSQGIAAHIKGIMPSDCPYGEGNMGGSPEEVATYEARQLWLSGWKWQEQHASLIDPRVTLPIVDQNGKKVGNAYRKRSELSKIDAYVDSDGTAWLPPTAWAYFTACRALRRAHDLLGAKDYGKETGSEGKVENYSEEEARRIEARESR